MACMSDKLYVHISINDRDLFETAWVEYTSLNNYNTTTYILPQGHTGKQINDNDNYNNYTSNK